MNTVIDKCQVCKIAPGVRLQFEKVQQAWVLLYPEGMVTLDEVASDILRALDGVRNTDEVVTEMRKQYGEAAELDEDVLEFLCSMIDQGWVRCND